MADSSSYSSSFFNGLGFDVVILIILLFILSIFIVNAVYFGKIKKAGGATTSNGTTNVSPETANALVWINSILAAITGILFLMIIAKIVMGMNAKSSAADAKVDAAAPAGTTTVVHYAPSAPPMQPVPQLQMQQPAVQMQQPAVQTMTTAPLPMYPQTSNTPNVPSLIPVNYPTYVPGQIYPSGTLVNNNGTIYKTP